MLQSLLQRTAEKEQHAMASDGIHISAATLYSTFFISMTNGSTISHQFEAICKIAFTRE
jgi:hypothetical protein